MIPAEVWRPQHWVELSRIEAARRMLEYRHISPKQVSLRCGFADVNVLRRAFRRRLGVTLADYRHRHGSR